MRIRRLGLGIVVLLVTGSPWAWADPGVAAPRALARQAAPSPFEVTRGPIEIRDEYLLAQPRMTLPATTPDVLPCGCWELVLHGDWGSDFAFSQDGPAEDPRSDRRYLVDGEHRTLGIRLRRGLGRNLDVTVRLPVQWRGAGVLDAMIDWFHANTPTDDNARPEFDQNKYRVEGKDAQGRRFDWNDEHGTGLGNAEVALRWAFLRPRDPRGLRAALVGRLGLPTGTGPFETGSVELGAQVVLAKQLHRRVDLYGGAGVTWYAEDEIRGFVYEPWRGYAFCSAEWRIFSWASLYLQTDASSRLITNVLDYPGLQWYAQIGAKADLSRRTRFVLGMTENLIDQQSTLDVGMWAGLETRF